MLNNNNHNSSCEFSAEIVSYLYNESSEAARGKFESHLVGCGVCTDEFATISNARFSVFEWQKDEFAHLPTPEIVIPYAANQPESGNLATVGFLSGLRELLSFSNWPSTVTVAAALAVCLGLGFLAMTYIGRGDQQFAGNNDVEDRPVPSFAGALDVPTGNEKTPDVNVATAPTIGTTEREPRPVRAGNSSRPRFDRQTTGTPKYINNVARQNSTLPKRKIPVLNGFEDDDDNSLRLADLFDEIGGGL